jgi:small ligand-binding sensory domain FIST
MTFVTTGLSHGGRSRPEHAANAVREALARANLERANAVLLFLTPDYATDPLPALKAAARAAGCLQVFGATGAGILTDQEWVLDSPGAAAMVFGGPVQLGLAQHAEHDSVLLSLSTPTALTADWLDIPSVRLGAVSGDLFGHGPFTVWANARVVEDGRAQAVLAGCEGAIGVSQGVRALTSPIEIAQTQGYELLKLGNYPALNVLVQSLPEAVREMEPIPIHLIMGGVTIGEPHTALKEGRYRLNHIVDANEANQSLTLSNRLHPGERLFWAMRDSLVAEREMRDTIEKNVTALGGAPDFALLFPCMGRGPHFFGNRDRDLDQLRARFPGLPIIGLYGNGEIGPLDGVNHLYQYSAVLGLFKVKLH